MTRKKRHQKQTIHNASRYRCALACKMVRFTASRWHFSGVFGRHLAAHTCHLSVTPSIPTLSSAT